VLTEVVILSFEHQACSLIAFTFQQSESRL